MQKFKNKNTYLVMGSNSFSGSNLIDYLLNKKHKVVGISRSSEILDDFLPYKKNLNLKLFTFKQIDINKDISHLKKIVLKYKGRVYLSKDTRLSSFYFSKFYNQFEEVINVRKKYNIFNFSSNQSKRIGINE